MLDLRGTKKPPLIGGPSVVLRKNTQLPSKLMPTTIESIRARLSARDWPLGIPTYSCSFGSQMTYVLNSSLSILYVSLLGVKTCKSTFPIVMYNLDRGRLLPYLLRA